MLTFRLVVVGRPYEVSIQVCADEQWPAGGCEVEGSQNTTPNVSGLTPEHACDERKTAVSYVWSKEQVEQYISYYQGIATRGSNVYLTFETTEAFARSVLPPCLEVASKPEITISFGSFMEIYEGYPNRPGRDSAVLIGLNARLGDREGSYFLTVVETEEVNVVTGREVWGMPKKIGTVDYWEDGKDLWAFAERKGHRLVEIQATVGSELGPQEASTEYYFELRGQFAPDMSSVNRAELVVFEMPSETHRFRELSEPHVQLKGSPFDRGVDTLELGEFVAGGLSGGETGYKVVKVEDLSNDGNDYAPYLLGRFYDTWEDYGVQDRPKSPTTL